jgi:hypothetical protein
VKKDCSKYKKWFIKKGKLIYSVCHEYVFIEATSNTWWIDSGSIIHIVNTMHNFSSLRKPKGNERGTYLGN